MAEADDDMFASMIAEAMGSNARVITPNKRPVETLCPCGSGQHGYNLFNHKGELLLYCCHACEQPRRAQLKDGGGMLTGSG